MAASIASRTRGAIDQALAAAALDAAARSCRHCAAELAGERVRRGLLATDPHSSAHSDRAIADPRSKLKVKRGRARRPLLVLISRDRAKRNHRLKIVRSTSTRLMLVLE